MTGMGRLAIITAGVKRMIVTRFYVKTGRIEERILLDTDDLDPEILREARGALERLRGGEESVQIKTIRRGSFRVGVGIPSALQPPASVIKPELVESYEQAKDSVGEYMRRTAFYLEWETGMRIYKLVPADTEKEDAGLFGAIGGTMAALRIKLPEGHPDRLSREESQSRCHALEAEIRAARPAFVTFVAGEDSFSRFADCFAVAMLMTSGEWCSCDPNWNPGIT